MIQHKNSSITCSVVVKEAIHYNYDLLWSFFIDIVIFIVDHTTKTKLARVFTSTIFSECAIFDHNSTCVSIDSSTYIGMVSFESAAKYFNVTLCRNYRTTNKSIV